MFEVYVSRRQLVGLLNAIIYISGDYAYISVLTPYTKPNRSIFEITLRRNNPDADVRIASKLELRSSPNIDEQIMCEIPTDEDLYKAAIMSNIAEINKLGEIIKKIDSFSKRDPLKGSKLGYLTFDTNAFYLNVVDHIIRYIEEKNIRSVGILLIQAVKDEINRKFKDRKIDRDFIDKLSEALKHSYEELSHLHNNLCREDRYWFLALSLYKRVKQRVYSMEFGERGYGDEAILGSIVDFIEKFGRAYDIAVVTADQTFAGRLASENIETITISKPPIGDVIGREYKSVPLIRVADLLYFSAIIFGKITLETSQGKINIKGVWRGKRTNHYDNEIIKITTRKKALEEKLRKTVGLLSKLLGRS